MFWPCVYRKWAVEGAKVNQKKRVVKHEISQVQLICVLP